VQVKNKPCVEYIIIMHLISWIYSRGSETQSPGGRDGEGKKKEWQNKKMNLQLFMTIFRQSKLIVLRKIWPTFHFVTLHPMKKLIKCVATGPV
jgi:hypothetical protein